MFRGRRRDGRKYPSFFLTDITEAFNLFDKNGDGTISAKELGAVLKGLGITVEEAEVTDMLKNGDIDGKV